MRVIEIIGFDVVDKSTGAIVAPMVPDRATAEAADAAYANPSIVIPVLNFAGARIGYQITA